MNKQIILDALTLQHATKENEFLQFESTTHNPALTKLNESISNWLADNMNLNLHKVKFYSNILEITPPFNEEKVWPNKIEIRKYQDVKDKNYYEINYTSNCHKVNENNIDYLTTLGRIAAHFPLITEKIESKWQLEYDEIIKPYYVMTSELRKLEQEMKTIKQEIDNHNRDAYKAKGFQHTLSPWLNCTYVGKEDKAYELIECKKVLQLQIGKGKWDCVYVNTYRVVGPTKYNKIAIQIKKDIDAPWVDIKVKNDYFNNFINDVYMWEIYGKEIVDTRQTDSYNAYMGKKVE